MAEGITISGLQDCIKFFDNAPENMMKATRKALREASKETTKLVRAKTPKRWRRMLRYKVVKTYKGDLNAVFGLFNNKMAQGHQNPNGSQIDDWFKAYWLNYGTLDKRDPEHQFQRPVKHSKTAAARRRKNTAGIAPRKFFEQAIAGWSDPFVRAFQESLRKQENELYDR